MSATTAPATTAASSSTSAGLQERLHSLLNNLYNTTELLKTWPESEDASIHVETTTKLIESVQQILQSVRDVETKVMRGDGSEEDKKLVKELKEAPVPLDLLELMDYGGDGDGISYGGINPDVYARGLLREALRQLAGLKRRKLALELLGNAVSIGMARREKEREVAAAAAKAAESPAPPTKAKGGGGAKRKRQEDGKSPDEPPTKKA